MKNHPGDRVTKQIRLSLPNAAGALSMVTTAVNSAGGIVGEVHTLRNHAQQRVVQLDIRATSEQQWTAIRQALRAVVEVQIEAETDPTLDAHRGGLIGMQSRVPFRTEEDFTTFYTSGAIRAVRTLAESPHLVSLYTATPRLVVLVTTGEHLPRLGTVPLRAAMPLLEGQAVLLNTMLMLSGVPMLLDTRDPHEIVRTLVHIAPTFAAVVIEGIAAPGCYAVEEALRTQLAQPVWHDDQHGIAVVVLAALLTLAKNRRQPHTRLRVGLVGLGVAGIGIAKLLRVADVRQIWGTDPHDDGCQRLTQLGGTATTIEEVMREAEVIVLTSAVPGCLRPELVRRGHTLLALSSFSSEIAEAAHAVDAAYIADDQRHTSALVLPGMLRGTLDARSSRMTDAMKIAAAVAIMQHSRDAALLPSVLDPSLHLHVARAVQDCAAREKVASDGSLLTDLPMEKE